MVCRESYLLITLYQNVGLGVHVLLLKSSVCGHGKSRRTPVFKMTFKVVVSNENDHVNK